MIRLFPKAQRGLKEAYKKTFKVLLLCKLLDLTLDVTLVFSNWIHLCSFSLKGTRQTTAKKAKDNIL